MQTLTIVILNDKAVKLIQEMKLLKLIRVRKVRDQQEVSLNFANHKIYKNQFPPFAETISICAVPKQIVPF